MKLLNDLKLQFEKELWALSPDLAVMDTILNQHPEIYDMLKNDITLGEASSSFGRQDMPTVEQIVRAGIYKEMKSLTYRELEYAQHDSRTCALFIKLDDRKPLEIHIAGKRGIVRAGDDSDKQDRDRGRDRRR